MELEFGGDGIDNLSLLPSNDLQSPDVIGITSSIFSVTSNLKVSLTDRSGFSMTVNISSGCNMFQSDKISVLDQVHHSIEICVVGRFLVPFLDHKEVVLILVSIRGHLLLLGSHTFWIQMKVRMKVSSSSSVVLQCHHCSISYFSWHGGIVQSVANQ